MHRSEYFSEWAFSRELASRAFESREAPVNVLLFVRRWVTPSSLSLPVRRLNRAIVSGAGSSLATRAGLRAC